MNSLEQFKKYFFVATGICAGVFILIAIYFMWNQSRPSTPPSEIVKPKGMGKSEKRLSLVTEGKENISEKAAINQESSTEILNSWKFWSEGVYIRDKSRTITHFAKSVPSKIIIKVSFNQYEYDRLFDAKRELVSSAKENMDENRVLTIYIGYSKKYFANNPRDKNEKLLSLALFRTLYTISHIENDYTKKENDLRNLLIDFQKSNQKLINLN